MGVGVGGGKPEQCVDWSISHSQSVGKLVSQSVNQFANFLSAEQALLFPLTSTLSPSLFLSRSALRQSLLEEECAIFEIPFGIPGLRAP